MLVGPSAQSYKEIIQIENNMVKNPNWQEADQLAIYKRVQGVELGATEKQLLLVVGLHWCVFAYHIAYRLWETSGLG